MKRKKYECIFDENNFIDEEYPDYKNKCDFFNRLTQEPYKKFYDNHLFRYLLKCKIKDQGKLITVILMNPSFADEYGLDSTLCNVKEFLEKQKNYSEFEVLNIFPIRTPNSKNILKLMKKYEKIQKTNNEYIINSLKSADEVLVAWGRKYHSYAKWIFKYLNNKKVYAYSVNKDGSPTHFAPQVYYNRNKEINFLQEYKI